MAETPRSRMMNAQEAYMQLYRKPTEAQKKDPDRKNKLKKLKKAWENALDAYKESLKKDYTARPVEQTIKKEKRKDIVKASTSAEKPVPKVTVDDTTKRSEASKRVEKSIEPPPPPRARKDAPTLDPTVAEEKRRRVRKGFEKLEKGTEAGRRKAAREKTAKTERKGFAELDKNLKDAEYLRRSKQREHKSATDFQVGYNSPNRPGVDAIGVRRTGDDPPLTATQVKTGVNKALKALDKKQDTGGRFGTAAGKRAIKSFFEDAFGIKDISVDYSFPGDKGYGSPQGGKKKGGKVTSKRSSTKKYAMNRGGKVASVRKPTRA